jgi:hypothetical protein
MTGFEQQSAFSMICRVFLVVVDRAQELSLPCIIISIEIFKIDGSVVVHIDV